MTIAEVDSERYMTTSLFWFPYNIATGIHDFEILQLRYSEIAEYEL